MKAKAPVPLPDRIVQDETDETIGGFPAGTKVVTPPRHVPSWVRRARETEAEARR